ncbi:hypothetical protein BX600DRAFT_315573 [Xylariales sp. PMI_506]|nr:hypothetical protein BX600DRAFT_315573 [Xylariales sp. PMI_506]
MAASPFTFPATGSLISALLRFCFHSMTPQYYRENGGTRRAHYERERVLRTTFHFATGICTGCSVWAGLISPPAIFQRSMRGLHHTIGNHPIGFVLMRLSPLPIPPQPADSPDFTESQVPHTVGARFRPSRFCSWHGRKAYARETYILPCAYGAAASYAAASISHTHPASTQRIHMQKYTLTPNVLPVRPGRGHKRKGTLPRL